MQVSQLGADLALALGRQREAEAKCRQAQSAARQCGDLLLGLLGRISQPAQSSGSQGQQMLASCSNQQHGKRAVHAGHHLSPGDGRQPAARSAFRPVESRQRAQPAAPAHQHHEQHLEPASPARIADQRPASAPLGTRALPRSGLGSGNAPPATAGNLDLSPRPEARFREASGRSAASAPAEAGAAAPPSRPLQQLPSASDTSAEQRSDPNSFSFHPYPPAGLANT
jgi:hypothetical protein